MTAEEAAQVVLVWRLRESGQVRRCHVLPHNDPGYTDGKHSFDALSMLLILHPDPSVDLIKAVTWHDMGERYVGDLPASAKFASRKLNDAYCEVETEVIVKLYPPLADALARLTHMDVCWLKALDAMEFAMWCEDQIASGNRHVVPARQNIAEYLRDLQACGGMPDPCVTFIKNKGLAWARLPERFDRTV